MKFSGQLASQQHGFAQATSPLWLCFCEQHAAAQLWVCEEQGSSGIRAINIRKAGYQKHEQTRTNQTFCFFWVETQDFEAFGILWEPFKISQYMFVKASSFSLDG